MLSFTQKEGNTRKLQKERNNFSLSDQKFKFVKNNLPSFLALRLKRSSFY